MQVLFQNDPIYFQRWISVLRLFLSQRTQFKMPTLTEKTPTN